MWRIACLAGLFAIIGVAGAPVHAADVYTDCYKYTTDDAAVAKGITVCTRLINSGRYKGEDLARLMGNRANGYIKQKKYDLALADAKRSISIKPDYVFSYDHLGEVLRLKGDTAGALEAYATALRLDPTFIAAHYDRGVLYEQQGDVQKAKAEYERTLSEPGKNRPLDDWAKREAQKALDRLARGS